MERSSRKKEKTQEELAFIKAVLAGLTDIENDRVKSLEEVKKKFGLIAK